MRSSSPTISPVAAGLSQARPCPNSRQKQSLNRFSTRPRVGICSLPFGFASSIPCDSFSISVFHQEHAVSPFFSPAADLLQIVKSKEGGLDVIDTYVFWSLHEPLQNQYDFEGRKDLVKFVKTVGDAGLYVYLAVGPFICGEWNYGGFPLWLHFIPRIQFRTDNEPFKREMQCFTAKIVDMIKQEKLFASQGGPIILAQIENEYGIIASPYGSAAKSYINWAASMATSLDTGVPWVMSIQGDAPDPIVPLFWWQSAI